MNVGISSCIPSSATKDYLTSTFHRAAQQKWTASLVQCVCCVGLFAIFLRCSIKYWILVLTVALTLESYCRVENWSRYSTHPVAPALLCVRRGGRTGCVHAQLYLVPHQDRFFAMLQLSIILHQSYQSKHCELYVPEYPSHYFAISQKRGVGEIKESHKKLRLSQKIVYCETVSSLTICRILSAFLQTGVCIPLLDVKFIVWS